MNLIGVLRGINANVRTSKNEIIESRAILPQNPCIYLLSCSFSSNMQILMTIIMACGLHWLNSHTKSAYARSKFLYFDGKNRRSTIHGSWFNLLLFLSFMHTNYYYCYRYEYSLTSGSTALINTILIIKIECVGSTSV